MDFNTKLDLKFKKNIINSSATKSGVPWRVRMAKNKDRGGNKSDKQKKPPGKFKRENRPRAVRPASIQRFLIELEKRNRNNNLSL
jgi:hypothetical protein